MVALTRRLNREALEHQPMPEVAEEVDDSTSSGTSFLAAASSSTVAAAAASSAHRLAAALPVQGHTALFDGSTPVMRYISQLSQQHPHSTQNASQFKALVLQVAEQQPMWVIGLLLMVIGTFASALGMLCLKRAHGPANATIPWYKNQWFWGGIFLFAVTAAGLDVIVFAITPLALIAPFAGLTIVITFLFSTVGCCGVRETPTKTSFVAVVFITIGVTICSVFGPHDNGSLDPAQLSVFFIIHPGLYILCVLGGAGFFIFSFVTTYFKDSHPAIGEALRSWGGALTLSLVAACFGSLTQLQFKALASALMEGVQDLLDSRRTPTPMYNSPAEFVLQLVAVASSAIAQVGFLNYAISVAPVAYSVPSYQAGLLISTLLLSGWILDEYVLLSPIEAVMFWLGAGVVGCGMLLNAWGLVRAAAAAKGGEGEGGEMEGDVKKGAALLDGAGADAEFGKAASSKFS